MTLINLTLLIPGSVGEEGADVGFVCGGISYPDLDDVAGDYHRSHPVSS